ncbi:TerB family tellurite resistance protein, partial [bacterium]|nr:TerB family tellurite resistance protein [bacterium]
MLRQFKKLFTLPEEEIKKAGVIDLTLAVCVILLETAQADDVVTSDEREHLLTTLKSHYNLDRQEAEDLLEAADQT